VEFVGESVKPPNQQSPPATFISHSPIEQDRQDSIFEEVGYLFEEEIDEVIRVTREMGLRREEEDKAHPQYDRQPAVDP
jgi:hypothetical protein